MAKGIGSYIKKRDEKKLKSINHCMYCGSENGLMIDHIMPVSKGGNSEIQNLTRCCNSCNSSKSDKTINEFFRHILNRRQIAQLEYEYCQRILDSISDGSYIID
jgi:5-methylcytosine-specific restriction endonuclease McrA